MDHRALFEVAKLLLSEDDPARTAELVFRKILAATGARRGFVVVKEGDSFAQKLDLDFDRERVGPEVRRFSRTVVRRAIESREVLVSNDPSADPRFLGAESLVGLGRCGVLVAPLVDAGEAFGAIYLERDVPARELDDLAQLMAELAAVAGLSICRALEWEALAERSRSVERDLFAQRDFTGIVTRDPEMLRVLKVVAQIADSDAAVLIRGETGTGKELIARAVHANSLRREKPFVVLHCTALAGTLLESELFGHVKGAFTGAERDRTGRLASAAGGTLFLDEVAEIPPEVQVKLLRFLQFGEVQRLGSDRLDKIDVRVVAATHEDLQAQIQRGRFRQDLYFRLRVVEINLPPLRARRSDLPLLIERLLREKWRRPGPPPRLTPRAERALLVYAYPGNIRELQHALESACLLASGPEIDLDVLPAELTPVAPLEALRFERYTQAELDEAKAAAVREVEQSFIEGLLERADGNVSQAARDSGIHRTQLQRLIARVRPS